MYEWLADQVRDVATRKFFLFDSVLSPQLREYLAESSLPPSYKTFLDEFGGAKLYRSGSMYLVQVFSCPVEVAAEDGTRLLQFGRTDLSQSYFKESLLVSGVESPVFEWRHEQGVQETHAGFENWLRSKCNAARGLFKKKDWENIVRGPSPFSDRERAIVEARARFRWHVVGIASNGDLKFEVHNGSNLVLPFLSIGIRGTLRPPRQGPLDGGVWLPVSSVLPGETRIIEKDCYKDLVAPQDIEAFDKPPPEPEDRERYWEFK